jgi:polyphenol oxidase
VSPGREIAVETVEEFGRLGVVAFTTGRAAGSFGTSSEEPVSAVMGRWGGLRRALRPAASRLATSVQVHGARVAFHGPSWEGWLRADETDGHLTATPGTAMAVTIADCVPVFLAHQSGAVGILHSGWRGTAAGILGVALGTLEERGFSPADITIHLGPAICGDCYQVSPEVHQRLTGRSVPEPTNVDLRALLATQARARGASRVSTSTLCTRCDNGVLFSHRAGDDGRQLGIIVSPVP